MTKGLTTDRLTDQLPLTTFRPITPVKLSQYLHLTHLSKCIPTVRQGFLLFSGINYQHIVMEFPFLGLQTPRSLFSVRRTPTSSPEATPPTSCLSKTTGNRAPTLSSPRPERRPARCCLAPPMCGPGAAAGTSFRRPQLAAAAPGRGRGGVNDSMTKTASGQRYKYRRSKTRAKSTD